MKLILEINVAAGHEDEVLAKVKAIYNNPFISMVEQLSDFYVVLDFNATEAMKALEIQKLPGIIDIKMTPVMDVFINPGKIKANSVYLVFLDVERGKEEAVMDYFKANSDPLYKVRNAGFIFDYRGDLIVEISTDENPDKVIPAIRRINHVRDTIFYSLPKVYSKN
jgi:hypothetical protein